MINHKRVNSPFERKGTPPVISINRAWVLYWIRRSLNPPPPPPENVMFLGSGAYRERCTFGPFLWGSLCEGFQVSQGQGMFYKPGEVLSMQGSCPIIAVPPSSLLAPTRYEKLGLQMWSRRSCCTLIRSSYL